MSVVGSLGLITIGFSVVGMAILIVAGVGLGAVVVGVGTITVTSVAAGTGIVIVSWFGVTIRFFVESSG